MNSREIMFCFNNQTQWWKFLLLYGHHFMTPQKGTNMASPYSTKLNKFRCNTFLTGVQMENRRDLNLVKVVYIYMIQSSIISQTSDLI